jgi:hypothetical protein
MLENLLDNQKSKIESFMPAVVSTPSYAVLTQRRIYGFFGIARD